jgi:phosphoglucosamine mutase
VARAYFGTDGVRGVVGEKLTPELVERLGKASTLWSRRGRVFVGRDTRGSGPELEDALARGIASAGGSAVLGGILPTPAVALLALDLGAVITASHNPPQYNGVKFFDRDGRKLTDIQEEQIEALLDADAPGGGEIDHVSVAPDSYLEHLVERFGSDLSHLRIGIDCANGAYSARRWSRTASTSESPSTATATACWLSTPPATRSTATRSCRSSRCTWASTRSRSR